MRTPQHTHSREQCLTNALQHREHIFRQLKKCTVEGSDVLGLM
jgi:hypothetical protein